MGARRTRQRPRGPPFALVTESEGFGGGFLEDFYDGEVQLLTVVGHGCNIIAPK